MKKTLLGLVLIGLLIFAAVSVFAGSHGAIAYSSSTGKCGYSNGCCTIQEAIELAISFCGAPDCEAKNAFFGSCGAIAKASNGLYGSSGGYDCREKAEARALAECARQGGGDCKVICWSCAQGGCGR